MPAMETSFPLECDLPAAAEGAVAVVRRLVHAGHTALLAGGCVRDLLLGRPPHDFDVATDAAPERVRALFRAARLVGAQFGVVLVRQRRRWIEVATFRTDGPYLDGRHPAEVHFTDAREDARRRDFTVNGMFLDPLARTEPGLRFEEDRLRLLRAVRFAAKLDFVIEEATCAAIRAGAANLATVAAERIREELEKSLSHANRRVAFGLLRDTGLLWHLWPQAAWQAGQIAAADTLLTRLPPEAGFELSLAAMLADRGSAAVHAVARALTLSNEQRENTTWLVEHLADLDVPESVTLASLKRLMVNRAFGALCQWAEARYADMADGAGRRKALAERLASISPEAVQPPPLVTGDDLAARGLPPGPVYKILLDELYTRQLNETVHSREEALAAMEALLREHGTQT
jgi:poly(A) polymerase